MTTTPAPDHANIPSGADPDRSARILLAAAIEPGNTDLGRLIRTHGAITLLRLLFTDAASLPHTDFAALTRLRDRAVPLLTTEHTTEILQAIRDADLTVITPADHCWPHQVNDLGDAAPIVLFARGDHELLTEPGLTGICGARAATGYGAHVTTELTEGLAAHGDVIVASGSYGIAADAHRAALTAGGKTIAVLAGGLDRPYPAGHHDLFDRIVRAGGLIISEAPPTLTPTRWRFQRRSRLLAALTHRIVIVEAGARSGTLRLAEYAAKLGRPLGVVPGPITSAASTGCHLLIRDHGATLVTGPADVIALEHTNPATPEHSAYPALDSLTALKADWEDDPHLTPAQRRTLHALSDEETQDALTQAARTVQDAFYSLFDSIRSDTTQTMLTRHGADT
ncbi:DNA processing protein [Pseudarthrobacter oxydans]|uniref:DNA processing protein n=1 Tax=Pseudarthrobacter oxydans TaxID=1671 RepID=A0AAW8NI38_PSEOX|nr:DNA-processing protein DprA [Pseudarthrobacter oxydans]MDR7165767.1 DNA processing protein [Pseudarthrobacter oxydans]